jgi:hypothetical protein
MPKDAERPDQTPAQEVPTGPGPKVVPIPSEQPILRWPRPSDFVLRRSGDEKGK